MRVAITTLGCDKNRCDSEQLAANLRTKGYTITGDESVADILLVNTCSFIESARNEALDIINQKIATGKRVVVTGCMTVNYPELIPIKAEVWDIDKTAQATKLLSTPKSYVYIKIADGCDNRCAYCTIPSIRGGYTPRPKQDIIGEVEHFANLGVPEFILVAQDLTKYPDLVGLIREISQHAQKIRLHYIYPNGITDELINEVANNPKVCKYLDIPFQHVNKRITELMNRKYTDPKNLIEKFRLRIPNLALRSTFMVGFPTETDDEFLELRNFVQTAKLDYVGFFTYSRERGTTAYDMPQVPEKIKKSRLQAIERVQSDVTMGMHKKIVGRVVEVACDYYDGVLGYSVTRCQWLSPDVDPFIIVHHQLEPAKEYRVKIVGTHKLNLIGEIIS